MKALVTGASGFIGRNLSSQLSSNGFDVTGFDNKIGYGGKLILGDIASFDLDDTLEGVDIVFHLAGLLGTTELFHRIIEAERVNVLGTLNLLESMRRCGVSRVVFTSKPNVWRHNVYTITKENCERYLEMYKEIFGLTTVIAKPFNVYGSGESLSEYRKAIPYFIVSALRNDPLEVFGNGNQTMDAIYIDDAVDGIIKCAEVLPREVVEIGSANPITVNNLAEKIIKLVGSKSKIVHLPMRKGETDLHHVCANGNMERLVGIKPRIGLDEGLIRTIKWYKTHLCEFEQIYTFKKEDF